MKSVRIQSYSGPDFSTFGMNTERYGVRMGENTDQNNSEYGHFLRSDTLHTLYLKLLGTVHF